MSSVVDHVFELIWLGLILLLLGVGGTAVVGVLALREVESAVRKLLA